LLAACVLRKGRISSGAGHRLRGMGRRARDLLALSEMIEDLRDHGGLGDEADHAHFASAARTHKGVDFVHRRIISAQPRLSAARSAPCGVAAPSGASTGEGSAVAAALPTTGERLYVKPRQVRIFVAET